MVLLYVSDNPFQQSMKSFKFGMKVAFHHVELTDGSTPKTIFATHKGYDV